MTVEQHGSEHTNHAAGGLWLETWDKLIHILRTIHYHQLIYLYSIRNLYINSLSIITTIYEIDNP